MKPTYYKKFGELPVGFHADFNAAYIAFWKSRGMEPPIPKWHKRDEERRLRQKTKTK